MADDAENDRTGSSQIRVAGIQMEWHPQQGVCTFQGLPVAMMWVDTTLAGLMSGVQAMVGTERFVLALQSEGRKSVEADWQVISKSPDFAQGFREIARIAAVAGWGDWELTSFDVEQQQCSFRVRDSWEGRYQKALGVCWGSGMLAGKLAGYCSKLFETNCWADQTAFIARGNAWDEFIVRPSSRSVETEIESLLATDEATRADMAVALRKLEKEITERRRGEQALRESEERYRSLFENATVGIYRTTPAGQVVIVNPALLRMLGYSSFEEMACRNLEEEGFGPEYSRDSFKQRIEAEGEIRGLEATWVRPDGTTLHVRESARAIRGDNGEVRFYEGIVEDVTERKRAEAERIELERQLLHTQKLESLGVLAGGIAHDFNNLLMAILGHLDMALRDLPENSPAQVGIEQAIQSTRRTTDLTRQLLAYSGKGRFVVVHLSLRDLVRENTDLFRTALARTATFDLELSPEPSVIEADPGQVQQVIMNLITNASEAMGEEPGTITLRTGTQECDLLCLSRSRISEKPPPGKFVFLEVSDNGCGMDPETVQRIFDPFFTTKYTGRGLGMSAVQGIVRGHKGAILVDSKKGEGTTIRVFFPASEAQAVEPPAFPAVSVQTARRAPAPGTILIVDDEEVVRDLCVAFVERLGLKTIAAADGEEALALFRKHVGEIVCVLLDLTMPHMDGVRTFHEMKRLCPDVKVILCSGYNAQDATRQFTSEGLAGFLQKPYLLQDLENALAHVLADPRRSI